MRKGKEYWGENKVLSDNERSYLSASPVEASAPAFFE